MKRFVLWMDADRPRRYYIVGALVAIIAVVLIVSIVAFKVQNARAAMVEWQTKNGDVFSGKIGAESEDLSVDRSDPLDAASTEVTKWLTNDPTLSMTSDARQMISAPPSGFVVNGTPELVLDQGTYVLVEVGLLADGGALATATVEMNYSDAQWTITRLVVAQRSVNG